MLLPHSKNRRDQDLPPDPLEHFLVHDRRGRERPHAAGIIPLIVIQNPLVILRRGQEQALNSVGNSENRRLLPYEALFDDDIRAGGAKEVFVHHGFEHLERLLMCVADRDALAGGQPVRLDHQRDRYLGDIAGGLELLVGAKAPEFRRGDAALLHEFLRENLASFDPGCQRSGTEDGKTQRLKSVGNSRNERLLWPDHRQIDFLLAGKLRKTLDVERLNVQTIRDLADARIPRCAVEFRDERTLTDFPDEGVFPAAAADDEDFHSVRNPKMTESSFVKSTRLYFETTSSFGFGSRSCSYCS